MAYSHYALSKMFHTLKSSRVLTYVANRHYFSQIVVERWTMDWKTSVISISEFSSPSRFRLHLGLEAFASASARTLASTINRFPYPSLIILSSTTNTA